MQCYLCYYFFTHKKNLSSLSQYHHITISFEYFTSTQELAFTHLLINGSMSCLITPLTHCQPYTRSFSHKKSVQLLMLSLQNHLCILADLLLWHCVTLMCGPQKYSLTIQQVLLDQVWQEKSHRIFLCTYI